MYLNDILLLEYGYYFNVFNNYKINKFCFNSKDVKENDAFIAINSGYKYIDEAVANGCILVIIPDDIYYQNNQVLILKTHDIFSLLDNIAKFILKSKKVIKIAITGSNGKTTTKELISSVLKTKYSVLKSSGNKNNYLGLLETIFKLDQEDFLVMELGMNHLGEISKLSSILKPDICIITNIGSAHIGNLKSKKNIFKAKMEILDGNSKALLFVNGDDKLLKKTKSIKITSKMYSYKPCFKHLKMDYYLAMGVLKFLNFDEKEIIDVFNNYDMSSQRMNIIYKGSTIIIDDTYNASFESVVGGLSYLNEYKQDKIVILGDVLESGKYAKKIHKKINKYLAKFKNIMIYHVGNYTKYIRGLHFDNKQDLINYLKNVDIKNKVIYLKGSRKMELEIIRDNLLLNF